MASLALQEVDSRARRVAIEAAAAMLVATAFVCLLFWRIVIALDTTIIGPASDAPATIGWLWSVQREGGYHIFGNTHHTLTGAPFGWDSSNGLNIQWLLPYYPAYLLTKIIGPVAAHNVVILSGYVFSAAAMYLLVRYVGCGRLVAAWAGVVYIVFPWHLMRAVHPSLVHLEFLPLLFLALLAAARNPTWSRFLLVGAVTLACWLTSGYFGAMAAVGGIAFAAGVALAKTQGRLRFVVLSATSGLAATLLIGGVARFADVGRGGGLNRRVQDVYDWGVHLVELVVPAAGNFLFSDWTRPFWFTRQHKSYPVETTNYVGILTIALALAWLVIAWRRPATVELRARLATPGFAVLAVVALLFALPGRASLFGHDIWMPSRLLWQVVPAFRVPSRWSMVVMTALVPLAALALREASQRASRLDVRWPTIARPATLLVVGAMVVSFLELGVDPTAARFSIKDVPPEYVAVSRTPRGIVAEYPLVPQIDYVFWQVVHERPLLNTDAFGTPADDAQHALVNPSTPGTAQQLALLGVTAIVTHPNALRWSSAEHLPNPQDWGPGYRLVARLSDGASVWRVVARPAPAFVAAVSGFAPPEALGDGTPAYALTSSSGVGYLSIRAKEDSVARLSFEAEPPRGQQRVLRVADDARERGVRLHGRTKVSLLVKIPRGFSLVLLKTDPAPTSREDAIVLSRIRVEPADGTPELQALLQDVDPGW